MKLCQFSEGAQLRAGLVVEDDVIDLSVVAPELPRDLSQLLAAGPVAMDRVRACVNNAAGRRPLVDIKLSAPIRRPEKFFAVGLTYADHVAESSFEAPEVPTIFTKPPSSIVGPGAEVQRPLVSEQLDYEGELGFVISRRCRNVPASRAASVIGGYMVINDFSVRDWQLRTTQWTLGKGFDTHGAIGPWIETGDDLDPHDLDLKTFVNGELRQASNTRQLVHDCSRLVELLSTVCTLEPGDIVATGTPGGVGKAMAPPQFLRAGDEVCVRIGGIGELVNYIVDQPNAACLIEPGFG